MRWVRNSRRFGSYLALAALVLQLALAFGHLHLGGLRHYPAGASAGAGAHAAQSAPVQHPGNSADDDYCAICATIYLAANSFLPLAPRLPAPPVAESVEHFSYTAAALIAPRRAPFQSRAPPLA